MLGAYIFIIVVSSSWIDPDRKSTRLNSSHQIISYAVFCLKKKKETQALSDTLIKMDVIDIYRTCHPKTTEYTFFSSTHGTFSRIDHILGHKSSLGKFKKIEIISSIFSDHKATRLDINYRKQTKKIQTHGG